MSTKRAKWSVEQEKTLLETFLELRNMPQYKGDKGLQMKGWIELTARLASAFDVAWDKGQYKSKYERIMKDYDLYKYITSLSGAGVCPTTGKVTLDDDAWIKIMEAKPDRCKRLKTFKESGFDHTNICSIIAGDTRATGASATSIGALVESLDAAPGAATAASKAIAKPTEPKQAPVVVPPGDSDRKANIKRIRDGARKEKQKKLKTDGGDADFMKDIVKAYFSFKMAKLKREENAIAAAALQKATEDAEDKARDEFVGTSLEWNG